MKKYDEVDYGEVTRRQPTKAPAAPASTTPAVQMNRPPAETLAASLQRANAALNPMVQGSFRAAGEGSGFASQLRPAMGGMGDFFGDAAVRAQQAQPFYRAMGAGRVPVSRTNAPISDPTVSMNTGNTMDSASQQRARIFDRMKSVLGF